MSATVTVPTDEWEALKARVARLDDEVARMIRREVALIELLEAHTGDDVWDFVFRRQHVDPEGNRYDEAVA